MEMAEIGCHNCIGACCRLGISMVLSDKEAEYMQLGGTLLTERRKVAIPGIEPLIPGNDEANIPPEYLTEYKLDSDCGYLVNVDGAWLCSIYEDPRRPQICQRFSPGSIACKKIRVFRGVDMPDETAVTLQVNLNALDYKDGKGMFESFASDELDFVSDQNPWLIPIFERMADGVESKGGPVISRQLLAGLLYAHRMLRVANEVIPLPEKTDNDIFALLKAGLDANARADRKNSLLEDSFRRTFDDNEQLVSFVYDKLRDPMCRYGMELLLLLYEGDIDPQTLRINNPVPSE